MYSGENIEPQEIEEAILQSKLIQNVVLVGQDQRRLGAIVVANQEELQAAVKELKQSKGDTSEISKDDSKCVIHQEMNRM